MFRTTLFQYLSRQFLIRTAGVILALVALLELLELLERTTAILDRHLGLSGVLTFSLLRLPTLVHQVMLLGVLIGGIMTFAGMNRASEIVVLRSAGLTVYRLALMLVPCVLGLGLFAVVMSDQVMTRSERALAVWWQATALPANDETGIGHSVRLRLGRLVVLADRMSAGGTRLEGVHIYERDGDGETLIRRIQAQAAVYEHGGWVLRQATEIQVKNGVVAQDGPRDRPWAVRLRPDNLAEMGMDDVRLSAHDTAAVLKGTRATNRPPSVYQTEIYRRLAEPLAMLVMLLLSLPAIFMPPRSGYRSPLPILCVGAGLSFLLVDGILRAMGDSGTIPPSLAAVAGIAIFSSLALVVVSYLEES
jgi:lipopolysaccharide export system permease protein